MTDIVLRDIDRALRARIDAIAQAHGWSPAQALEQLLAAGLEVIEGRAAPRFDGREEGVMDSAIDALKRMPDDPGFAMIGRAGDAPDGEAAAQAGQAG